MNAGLISRAVAVMMLAALIPLQELMACTGISFKAADGSVVLARSIEWGNSELPSTYVIVPRGMEFVSYTPSGQNGMKFKAKYGHAGIAVVKDEFIAEGLNEAGLSAGLFYFPGYGKYPSYDSSLNSKTLADLQFVSWVLSSFATVDELLKELYKVRLVAIEGTSTVHWRVADATGRQIVIEIVDGETKVYENTIGVLTNAPGFEWQVTNLNNYVNLYSGGAQARTVDGVSVHPFGAGSGMLGLPGDVTPPSRFVRAFFYKTTAPLQKTGLDCVMQCFHILNNFDIPVGVEHEPGKSPDIPSATQWTAAADLSGLKLYYRTMYNSNIRCIDLSAIDFSEIGYVSRPLDESKQEPVVMVDLS